jgi:tRNA pseudouridine38-40 synthase
MRNIKLILEYDGFRYNGWQRQTDTKSTVQGRIEFVLEQMLGSFTELIGAGRTDTGVHALKQVANFKTNSRLSVPEMKDYLDQYLPDDINLLEIAEADENFHSRYNARGKYYFYQIWNSPDKNIFERRYNYHIRKSLDLKLMNTAKDYFVGEKDFKNFSAVRSKTKSTVRKIDKIEIRKDGDRVVIHFYGNGFLHKMVRIITGTIIQTGLKEIELVDIEKMFQSGSRAGSGFTAPPYALFLGDVYFDII